MSVFVLCFWSSLAISSADKDASNANSNIGATLDETRLTMDKWIEAQQIISQERKDWQQGKEILSGRLELVKKEITNFEEKTRQVYVVSLK